MLLARAMIRKGNEELARLRDKPAAGHAPPTPDAMSLALERVRERERERSGERAHLSASEVFTLVSTQHRVPRTDLPRAHAQVTCLYPNFLPACYVQGLDQRAPDTRLLPATVPAQQKFAADKQAVAGGLRAAVTASVTMAASPRVHGDKPATTAAQQARAAMASARALQRRRSFPGAFLTPSSQLAILARFPFHSSVQAQAADAPPARALPASTAEDAVDAHASFAHHMKALDALFASKEETTRWARVAKWRSHAARHRRGSAADILFLRGCHAVSDADMSMLYKALQAIPRLDRWDLLRARLGIDYTVSGGLSAPQNSLSETLYGHRTPHAASASTARALDVIALRTLPQDMLQDIARGAQHLHNLHMHGPAPGHPFRRYITKCLADIGVHVVLPAPPPPPRPQGHPPPPPPGGPARVPPPPPLARMASRETDSSGSVHTAVSQRTVNEMQHQLAALPSPDTTSRRTAREEGDARIRHTAQCMPLQACRDLASSIADQLDKLGVSEVLFNEPAALHAMQVEVQGLEERQSTARDVHARLRQRLLTVKAQIEAAEDTIQSIAKARFLAAAGGGMAAVRSVQKQGKTGGMYAATGARAAITSSSPARTGSSSPSVKPRVPEVDLAALENWRVMLDQLRSESGAATAHLAALQLQVHGLHAALARVSAEEEAEGAVSDQLMEHAGGFVL
ncbi:hypothetical protein EON66_01480 [archaeon]|nr:MAG: hypothetical protein EON66_01480 [archaeon]